METELAALAAETGLAITVCHRPLTSHQVIVHTIGATTTRTGLTVHAELDTGTAGRPPDQPPRLPRRMERQHPPRPRAATACYLLASTQLKGGTGVACARLPRSATHVVPTVCTAPAFAPISASVQPNALQRLGLSRVWGSCRTPTHG